MSSSTSSPVSVPFVSNTTDCCSSSSSYGMSSTTGSSIVTVAACNLNQWALDFDGNVERIYESCIIAKEQYGASYRLGPELEICGYGCEDHYYEMDTIQHCWESLILLLQKGVTNDNMICDFGMPVLYNGIRYNCRVICQNKRILLIRPKTSLADNGNYRESRYFTAYVPPMSHSRHDSSNGNSNSSSYEQMVLPIEFQRQFQQQTAPFGIRSLMFTDGISIGCESCEELWTPYASHIPLSLNGIDIITNGSGSHHELRKLNTRLDLIVNATKKCGGLYIYSNQRGCDGNRLYYDGSSLIVCNGIVLAQGKQFDVQDVQVIAATIDLNDVRSYRASLPSFGVQATHQKAFSTNTYHHDVIYLSNHTFNNYNSNNKNKTKIQLPTTPPLSSSNINSQQNNNDYNNNNNNNDGGSDCYGKIRIHCPEEECLLGPACWLWDYLRRSNANGFFLPLSGGADSSAVATIVYVMCDIVTTAAQQNPLSQVAKDVRRICHDCNHHQGDDNDDRKKDDWVPSSPQELAHYVLHTAYMGTENSSDVTRSRAKRLSTAINSYHLSLQVDIAVTAILQIFRLVTGGFVPQYSINGGSDSEDLALQNIQARLRMVLAYLFAQLLPWVRGTTKNNKNNNSTSNNNSTTNNTKTTKYGFLLVLGSANVDEGLRGYMTKYDCSSADLNPIGGISKRDLKKMLIYAATYYGTPTTTTSTTTSKPLLHDILMEIANAPPTAELRPNQGSTTSTSGSNNGNNISANDKEQDDKSKNEEHSQLDEDEMGMTYDELGVFGTLRKLSRCGPVSMYRKLCITWSHLQPSVVATKVKRFFFYYSLNRHKMCTITPAYHAEGYSPDDNRFDLRPFLYNVQWPRQFRIIDQLVQVAEEGHIDGTNMDKKDE